MSPSSTKTLSSISTCSSVNCVSVILLLLRKVRTSLAFGKGMPAETGYKGCDEDRKPSSCLCFGSVWIPSGLGGEKMISAATYPLPDVSQAGTTKQFDELSVQLVICVPGPSRKLDGRFKMSHHINLARRILRREEKVRAVIRARDGPIHLYAFDRFDELFLNKGLQTTIDYCLVQLSFCFEMFSPYP